MFFVTTAIDYPNGSPHIGHAYEKVLADVIARYHRLAGEEVYFLTGVDQHGQKVQQTAEKEGVSPAEYVATVTARFSSLWEKIGVEYDGWAETVDPRHKTCVSAILTDLHARDQIYKKSYKGFYSVRQEQFLTDRDRNEAGEFGAEWGEVTEIEEENYYFKLSEHTPWLRDFLEKSDDTILPAFRKAELVNALEKNTGADLCISRPKDRLTWGIALPFDDDFVTYVWFDALINYISFIGFTPDDTLPEFDAIWTDRPIHIIGKDILVPAHGIYWLAMLHALGFAAAEYAPRSSSTASGTARGDKMSKSLGNTLDPCRARRHLRPRCPPLLPRAATFTFREGQRTSTSSASSCSSIPSSPTTSATFSTGPST